MRNVTISLDEDLARKARVAAAEHDMSLSKFVAELLRKEVDTASGAYEAAKREFLSTPAYIVRQPGEALPTREEVHDRPVLRRH